MSTWNGEKLGYPAVTAAGGAEASTVMIGAARALRPALVRSTATVTMPGATACITPLALTVAVLLSQDEN